VAIEGVAIKLSASVLGRSARRPVDAASQVSLEPSMRPRSRSPSTASGREDFQCYDLREDQDAPGANSE